MILASPSPLAFWAIDHHGAAVGSSRRDAPDEIYTTNRYRGVAAVEFYYRVRGKVIYVVPDGAMNHHHRRDPKRQRRRRRQPPRPAGGNISSLRVFVRCGTVALWSISLVC